MMGMIWEVLDSEALGWYTNAVVAEQKHELVCCDAILQMLEHFLSSFALH